MDSTSILLFSFFFFNDTATTEIYTLSLHDALPISAARSIARKAREQQMVLPQPVDAEVLPRVALAREAGVFQEPDRGRIGRNAGGLEPVQAQRAECERHQRAHRAAHQPTPRERLADPV